MDYFIHPDKSKRVLIAGTFNAFPLTTAAAIATLKKLADPKADVYGHVDRLGKLMEDGLKDIFTAKGITHHIARQGSAFCTYFMDHAPVDFHDILNNHDFQYDTEYRKKLIENGIFNFPVAIKQNSISFAHSEEDIEVTLDNVKKVVGQL